MRYKRYGEVAVESSLEAIKQFIKKGYITEEKHKLIMSALPDLPMDNPFDGLAQLIGENTKFGTSPNVFYAMFDEYGQRVSEMKSTCLYADVATSVKLVDYDITLDVEFWKNFSGRFWAFPLLLIPSTSAPRRSPVCCASPVPSGWTPFPRAVWRSLNTRSRRRASWTGCS